MRTRARLVAAALVMNLAFGSGPLRAAPTAATAARELRVVVLPPTLADPANAALRQQVDEALRRGLTRGRSTVVEPGATPADGCAPACLAALAGETGAGHGLRTTIAAVERDYTIRLELVELGSGAVLASSEVACELCGLSEVGAAVADQAAQIRIKLEKLDEQPAILVVTSEPPGAQVIVDGVLIGTAPIEKVLAAGRHRVVVRRAGYVDGEREQNLVAGIREELRVPLLRSPQARRVRVAGWTTLALGVPAIVGGAALLAIAGQPVRGRCDGRDIDVEGHCRYVYTTTPIGASLVAVGAVLAVTGVVLLIRTRDRGPPAQVQAFVAPTGLGLAGAF